MLNVKTNGLLVRQSLTVPPKYCLEEIGGHLGGRDHTTVMHACSKIGHARSSDPEMHATLNELTKQITQVPEA